MDSVVNSVRKMNTVGNGLCLFQSGNTSYDSTNFSIDLLDFLFCIIYYKYHKHWIQLS